MSAVKIAACRPYVGVVGQRAAPRRGRRRRRCATTGPNTSLRAHLHVRRDVGEHGRAQHAVGRRASPPVDDLGAAGRRPRRSTTRPGRARPSEISADTSVASSSGSPTTSAATPLDQRGGEVVGDRAVHVDPLRRDAALPGVAEAGDLDLGGRRLPVAVGLDDDRRVVAELEADLLARRPGADAPADVGGEPVNVIRAMSGWSTRALPTVPPPPVTTWS